MTRSLERANYRVTFIVLLVGVSAFALLQSLVIPALPTIQADMHTSQNTVTWVVTAYLLSASIFTPIMGRIGDIVGKERMLVITLVALAGGTLIAAMAHTILMLIVGRAVQGFGGGVMPLSFGIIRDEFPSDKVAGGVGIIAAMMAVGSGVGLVIAGPIVTGLNYHWLFWIPLAIILMAAVCAYFFVPESPVRNKGRVDFGAAALLSAWLVALLLGVSEGPVWGWGSTKVLGLIIAAIILIMLWIRVESRSANPLIDMKMMRVPAVWTNNLVAFLFGVGMYSIFAFLPEFLQTPKSAGYGFGASMIRSGMFLLPQTVTMFIFGLLSGRIAKRMGSKFAVILGSIISCAGYTMLAFAHSQPWEIYALGALLGAGTGLAFSAMSNLIVQAVPASQTGVASGMNANIRTIGGAVGASVMSSIVTARLQTSGFPAESGYTNGFLFIAIVTVFAIIAACFIPARARDDSGEIHIAHAELAIVPGGTITEG
jgi:EmrB/QacA subfamily drug resistance transporter